MGRYEMQRTSALLRDLHFSWPWAVLGLAAGTALGLLVRIPFLPPPNQFTQTLWTTFAGALGGAAVTVIGTLHFARVSRRRETLDAAKALSTLMVSTVLHGQQMVKEFQPFPADKNGHFVRGHAESRSQEQWERYHTAAGSTRRAILQAKSDLQLYKPSCIGLDLEGRRALVQIEQTLQFLDDVTDELFTAADSNRQLVPGAEVDGSVVEAYRMFSEKLLEATKDLRKSGAM